jgi:CheY-like chemotaxis protein
MTSAARVLVVDDDPLLRFGAETVLRQRGFEVIAAASGADALELAREHAPDLMLLDMLMPGLSGLDVLRALRAEAATRALPVVVLSNASSDDEIEEARALGASACLVKAHISLRELADRVVERLTGARGG